MSRLRRLAGLARAAGRLTRPILVMGCAVLLACTQGAEHQPTRLVDLTHAYDTETIFWPTEEGFELEGEAAGETEGGYWYAANRFRTPEHGGTHLDAPFHFAEAGQTVEAVPLEKLIGPGVKIDVRAAAAQDRDLLVGVDALRDWETRHGPIPDGAIVLIDTGFAARWPDRISYMGTDERGAEAVAKLHFPGLAPEAAQWLVDERRIAAIGLDTPSIDYGQSSDFLAHRILFEANIPAFENVAAMDDLPGLGFEVIALPMKIRGGSGAPLRIIARIPTD